MSSTNVPNQTSFLRTSWEFPEDPKELSVQLNRSYLDIANSVNSRTIGVFPVNRPATTGNEYFTSGNRKQQSFRRLYQFTTTLTFPHGINFVTFGGFVDIYGTFVSGGVWYPLPYVDTAAIANQVSIKVNSTNIVITAGAIVPTSGFVVLEWLSQP